MVARRFTVCDNQQLRNLLSDSPRSDQQAEVVKHLEDCPKCQQELETMAGDESWWTDAREYLTPAPETDAGDIGVEDNVAGTEIIAWDPVAENAADTESQ